MNKELIKVLEATDTLLSESIGKEDIINVFDKLIDLFGFDIGNKVVEMRLFNSNDYKTVIDYILKNRIVNNIDDTVESEIELTLAFPLFTDIHYSVVTPGQEIFEILKIVNNDYEFKVIDLDYTSIIKDPYCFIERKENRIKSSFSNIEILLPDTIENIKNFVFGLMKLMQISHDLDFIDRNVKLIITN